MLFITAIPTHRDPIVLSVEDILRADEAWMPTRYRLRLAIRRLVQVLRDQTQLDEDQDFVAAIVLGRMLGNIRPCMQP